MSFVNRLHSDIQSLEATLRLVFDDPNFPYLHPGTQEAVKSFFPEDAALREEKPE
jgi:hypothetical protein